MTCLKLAFAGQTASCYFLYQPASHTGDYVSSQHTGVFFFFSRLPPPFYHAPQRSVDTSVDVDGVQHPKDPLIHPLMLMKCSTPNRHPLIHPLMLMKCSTPNSMLSVRPARYAYNTPIVHASVFLQTRPQQNHRPYTRVKVDT